MAYYFFFFPDDFGIRSVLSHFETVSTKSDTSIVARV